MEKQKTKTDGLNSIVNVVEKRKTKTESRIPFSDDVVNEKRNGKFESVFLFRRKTVGTKVHAFIMYSALKRYSRRDDRMKIHHTNLR